jgi:hypothetical protein
MDSLTFVSSLVQSLAWPAVVVVGVCLLRKPIANLIPLMQKLKYGDWEIDFGRRVDEVSAEIAHELPKHGRDGVALTGERTPVATLPEASPRLATLAKISPRSAVFEAWLDVEESAIGAALRLGLKTDTGRGPLHSRAIGLLDNAGKLEPGVTHALAELRVLRNRAAHVPEFALSEESALEYAASAAAMAEFLRNLGPGNSDDTPPNSPAVVAPK